MRSESKMNAEIVEVARLALALYRASDDEANVLGPRFQAEISRLGPGIASALVMMAMKLLEGSPYIINTNSPENARRMCSLAEYMGATITKNDPDDPWAEVLSETLHLRFDPSKRVDR